MAQPDTTTTLGLRDRAILDLREESLQRGRAVVPALERAAGSPDPRHRLLRWLGRSLALLLLAAGWQLPPASAADSPENATGPSRSGESAVCERNEPALLVVVGGEIKSPLFRETGQLVFVRTQDETNTYSYVNGNPINMSDPSGHDPCSGKYARKCYKDPKIGYMLVDTRGGKPEEFADPPRWPSRNRNTFGMYRAMQRVRSTLPCCEPRLSQDTRVG